MKIINKNVLIIAPHGDDEILGCGGTINKYVDKGYKVYVAIMTNANLGNPKKYNKYTPGTKIKIISENKSRKIGPDYYLVLPWHFKNEIIKRERLIRKKGTKLIFPLPKMQIV